MKKKISIKILSVVVLVIALSACVTKKKKKKCDTCPKWSYITENRLANLV